MRDLVLIGNRYFARGCIRQLVHMHLPGVSFGPGNLLPVCDGRAYQAFAADYRPCGEEQEPGCSLLAALDVKSQLDRKANLPRSENLHNSRWL